MNAAPGNVSKIVYWHRDLPPLLANAESHLVQEVARLEGDYAHVRYEALTPKHDDVAGEAWLHGLFTYMLYRRVSKAQ